MSVYFKRSLILNSRFMLNVLCIFSIVFIEYDLCTIYKFKVQFVFPDVLT